MHQDPLESKKNFPLVLGMLAVRLISLKNASEILNLKPDTLLNVLELMGIEFSYLAENDITTEKNWEQI